MDSGRPCLRNGVVVSGGNVVGQTQALQPSACEVGQFQVALGCMFEAYKVPFVELGRGHFKGITNPTSISMNGRLAECSLGVLRDVQNAKRRGSRHYTGWVVESVCSVQRSSRSTAQSLGTCSVATSLQSQR